MNDQSTGTPTNSTTIMIIVPVTYNQNVLQTDLIPAFATPNLRLPPYVSRFTLHKWPLAYQKMYYRSTSPPLLLAQHVSHPTESLTHLFSPPIIAGLKG